ncbi:MAG: hypothetical protein ABSF26_19350 [Thermoguttaceae bacterium]|jgi:hypothetical protein
MSREKEQLPDLTAFEAALAALAPRVERFDREQLIFQAGQAAALRDAIAVSPRGVRWGWPAAFSAMTAVAAALGVMLSTRAAPNVALPGAGPEAAAPGIADGRLAAEPPAPGSPVAAKTPVDRTPGAVAGWWPQRSAPEPPAGRGADAADPPSSLSYPRLREQFLRHGADWYPSEAVASAGATAVAQQPLPYYQLLDRLLKTHASDGSQPHPPSGID